MRYIIYTFFLLCLIILTLVIFIKPVIILLVKKQLNNVFIQSDISITDCKLGLKEVTFSGIDIKREELYGLKIKEARILYNLSAIFNKTITKIHIKDSNILLTLGQNDISDLKKYLRFNLDDDSKDTILILNTLEFSNLNLNFKARDLFLEANLSFELRPLSGHISYFHLKIKNFKKANLKITDAILNVSRDSLGEFLIQTLKYKKLKIEDIDGITKLENNNLYLNSLTAKILNGEATGNINFKIHKIPEYEAFLNFINCDLTTLAKDFELGEKFQISGLLNGKLILKGKATFLEILRGNFYIPMPGGILTIRDTQFLRKISQATDQSYDILVESFKNYYYNIGKIDLIFDDGNLVMEVNLDGQAGKRNLVIVVHDFKEEK